MRWIAIPCLVALLAPPAEAGRRLMSSDGVSYTEGVNNAGTILRAGSETIYLGVDCDALIPGRGRGWWSWNSGGTIVRVGRYTVAFRAIPLVSPGRCID